MITLDDIKKCNSKIDAKKILIQCNSIKNNEERWKYLISNLLEPDTPFDALCNIFEKNYNIKDWFNESHFAVFPNEENLKFSNISLLIKELNLENYKQLHKWSVTNRLSYWNKIIEKINIIFQKKYDKIASFEKGIEAPLWLYGAKFNIVDSCFKNNGNDIAIIYQKEGCKIEKLTYEELNKLSNRIANGLKKLNIKKGDSIAIDLPMTVESVAIYLAIIKYGAVVVSIADSLAANEVEKRLKIANTKLLFTQDILIRNGKELPLYEKLLKINNLPVTVVLPANFKNVNIKIRKQDIKWNDFLSNNENFQTEICDPNTICNILFSSGTTGEPKAIPWTHSTPIKCAADAYMHHNLKKGDIVAWPTNLGWMMGPWLIFASLINKCTIALYYGAPLGREFGEFVQNAPVNMLGLVPSMVKKWIETNCMKNLDWSKIKLISSTGESSNPRDYLWLMCKANFKHIIEYCGGTEIGGAYITGTVVQPCSPSTFSTPALALDFILLDEKNEQGNSGEVFLIPPSIGLSSFLLNKDHHKEYYEGTPQIKENFTGAMDTKIVEENNEINSKMILRKHGDEIKRLENNYYKALGRADDTMNLGGIKVSSVEIERCVEELPYIKESAAISINPKDGGPSQLIIYIVLFDETKNKTQILKDVQNNIKNKLNPLFKVYDIVISKNLVRTASNKIMRRVLRKQYEDKLI